MTDLSKEQYKMLCKIKKKKSLIRSSLSEKEISICYYLLKQECLDAKIIPFSSGGTLNAAKDLPEIIKLNQTGEAQIYAFRSTFYKWWIPVIISFGSLLISIFALIR